MGHEDLLFELNLIFTCFSTSFYLNYDINASQFKARELKKQQRDEKQEKKKICPEAI